MITFVRPKILTLAFLSALLSACAGSQVELKSDVDVPAEFEAAWGEETVDLDRWWLSWNDVQLTQLIETALQNNKDLASTRAKLEEARAMARAARANLGPTVGATATALGSTNTIRNPLSDGSRQVFQAVGSDLGDRHLDVNGAGLSGGITIAWEPDFFGRKQADADAAAQGALARAEEWHAAQMLLTTDLSDYYSQWMYYGERMALSKAQIQQLKNLQRYVQGRFNAGQTTAYETQQVATQLQAATAASTILDAQQADAERRIAVLTGQVPQQFKLAPPAHTLANLTPPLPQGQTPANVLNRRPDVRAHQAQVYAASAQLAAARADLLPRFNINFLGQGGVISLDSDLSSTHGFGQLLQVGVHVPIFTAGRIQANIDSKDANLTAALAAYDHSVLSALADVESVYHYQYRLRTQEQQLQQANRQAQQQIGTAQKLFDYGASTLDRVIEARLQLNELQSQLLELSLTKNQAMLNLYKALGGGWQSDSLDQDQKEAANELPLLH